MRGMFIRGDGLVLPNNISIAGGQQILRNAFRDESSDFFMALVTGLPTTGMTMLGMVEPTLGVNGYARVALPRSNVGWPTVSAEGTDAYIESQLATFTAAGGNFNQPIQRLALVGFSGYSAGHPVLALSEPLPAAVTITPTTPLAERQFRYRIYL